MSEARWIPAKMARVEIKVSNSTFIATAVPAFSVQEAKAAVQQIKTEYPDASHNVPVYIIGHPPSVIEHSSDDGEPAGTAGRPALSVLRASGFGDIVVVVTRYFGGTKLGTGGLVRAYSEAVREVLAILPKAQKVATVTTEFAIPYAIYEQVQRLIDTYNGKLEQPVYEENITLKITFLEYQFSVFQESIIRLTNGKITPQITSSNPNDIVGL